MHVYKSTAPAKSIRDRYAEKRAKMTPKRWLALAMIPLGIYFGLYVWSHQKPPAELEGIDNWTPTAEAVAASVRAAVPATEEARKNTFCAEFKKRFRDKQVAVTAKFNSPTTLKLLCAAVMPKWDMLRVAAALSTEATENFGHPFNVTIFETYISAEMKEVGELTRTASGKMTADFATGFPKMLLRPGRSRLSPQFTMPISGSSMMLHP